MTVFSDMEAKASLDIVLDQAKADGEVRIKRSDGQEFVLRPATAKSTLDVGYIDVRPTAEQIIRAIHDGRERGE